uniref:Uncharacterized protein n=1 Tax=Craspedostauros australis TaxID=1486917 RepID=A0A7R9ZLY3_9STRA|mmetsp:Transcript_18554/g.51607  ORF Transcript_18554/g.51607 Transcript_18554/m.51607 type:complete len:214 (+) Transcript_18554:129-770(+)
MKISASLLLAALVATMTVSSSTVSASVFIPYGSKLTQTGSKSFAFSRKTANDSNDADDEMLHIARRMRRVTSTNAAAMAIPGYGIAEQVFVGGFGNFLSIYNLVITARILLSWFPQAAGIAALQPVYQITDPYLNLFRGIIPPIFGLDLSPLLAFFLLSVLTNATAAVGADLTPAMKQRMSSNRSPMDKIMAEQQQHQKLQRKIAPALTLGSL